jgi:hypothetical protein
MNFGNNFDMNENRQILNKISNLKNLIASAREEKLRYDLEINQVQKSIKEFEVKKELKRRELLNNLIPVDPNMPEYRNISTAPEKMNRPRRRQQRNVHSAGYNKRIKYAIKESINALPGVSEALNNPDMIEAFRQSYLRDLNDYLAMSKTGIFSPYIFCDRVEELWARAEVVSRGEF